MDLFSTFCLEIHVLLIIFITYFLQEAKNLHLHRMQHAIKCEMCDYKCQQHKALSWHMKAKHGVDRTYQHHDHMTHVSSDDDVSEGERESLRVPPPPPSGPVFPGMSSSPVMRPAGDAAGANPVDLSVRRSDELCAEDGVIEITPVSPG